MTDNSRTRGLQAFKWKPGQSGNPAGRKPGDRNKFGAHFISDFYADWVQPIAERFGTVRAYRARLLKRPSFARAVEEARPYRSFFPPGAPDRD